MPTLAQHLRSVCISELDEVVVENLTTIFADTNLTATLSLSFNWVTIHQPIDHVQIVDVLFGDMIPTEPIEIVPIIELVLDFGLIGLAIAAFTRRLHSNMLWSR
jgi:hypothetical protein